MSKDYLLDTHFYTTSEVAISISPEEYQALCITLPVISMQLPSFKLESACEIYALRWSPEREVERERWREESKILFQTSFNQKDKEGILSLVLIFAYLESFLLK